MEYERRIFDSCWGSSKRRNNVGFFATEVDFSIKIDHHEFDFWEYREKIYHALSDKFEYRKNKENESPLEFFVRDRLKRMAKKEQISLFLTDYKEREGSFIITFSFLAFTAFMNYGQFRESLDYLRQDFNFLFRDVFPNNTTISVDYDDRPNYSFEDISENIYRRTLEIINKKFRKLIMAFVGIVGLVGIWVLALSFYVTDKVEKQPPHTTIESAAINSIIRAEIEKINAEKNDEELLRLLKQYSEQIKIDTQNPDHK